MFGMYVIVHFRTVPSVSCLYGISCLDGLEEVAGEVVKQVCGPCGRVGRPDSQT